jgi:hypothetical protein
VMVRGLVTRRGARGTQLAFGPYLLAGYVAALVLVVLSPMGAGLP